MVVGRWRIPKQHKSALISRSTSFAMRLAKSWILPEDGDDDETITVDSLELYG